MKRLFALASFAVLLAACSSGGDNVSIVPTGAMTPTPAPTPIRAGAAYVALGDSITYGMYAADYATQGYAAIFAGDLAANLTNLGIPGETSSGIMADEVAKIPSDAQVITLFIGTNDELGFIENGQSASSVESTFSSNMTRIASTLRSRFPPSRIFIANLPNLANFPEWTTASASTRAAISQLNQAMNATIDSLGFPVVDLRCDSQTYDPANLYQGGLAYGYVHPNTQGHAYYAADFYATSQGTLRESQSCRYANPV